VIKKVNFIYSYLDEKYRQITHVFTLWAVSLRGLPPSRHRGTLIVIAWFTSLKLLMIYAVLRYEVYGPLDNSTCICIRNLLLVLIGLAHTGNLYGFGKLLLNKLRSTTGARRRVLPQPQFALRSKWEVEI